MDILRVESLTKVYGKGETAVAALDNVSFSVKRVSLWLLSGRQGRVSRHCCT